MKMIRLVFFLMLILLQVVSLQAQKDSTACKVNWTSLQGSYTGDCKDGLASGKGAARGIHSYTGGFKNGMPNGIGTYSFSDSLYFKGNFQDGLKEGKGEMHYQRRAMADSIISGYWSADEFRGAKYITYNFTTTALFDAIEVTPSSASGNTITIEISTNSGAPNGVSTGGTGSGFVLTLKDLMSPTGSIVKTRSKFESSNKSYTTFELLSFPCKLFGTFSSGDTFELELFKAANWKARFFMNK
jgi:hypothetical protein